MTQKKTKVALIACSNGMGHVRRMLALAKSLNELGALPILLAPKEKCERLIKLYNSFKPKIINFESATKYNDWLLGKADNWIQDLPDLSDYDSIVSDNLLEALLIREDAWLSGSFLWQYSLSGIASEKVKNAEKILSKYNPRMISSSLFSAEYLYKKTRLFNVGLYSFHPPYINENNSDILIATGTGGRIENDMAILVDKISRRSRPILGTIWIEPTLWRSNMPLWMLPANFTPLMFQNVQCAIVRPGVGTVTDCLINGARVFSLYESGNFEMKDNALKIVEAELGEDCSNIELAWNAALNYYHNSFAQSKHSKALQLLDQNGATDAAALILENQDS